MEKFAAVAAEWWIKWAFGIVAGALVAGFKYLQQKQKAQEARQKALEDGMTAILRDRIVQAYYHYHDKGTITLHGLENVKGMYSAYKALGGNGVVDKLYADILELEVVDD